MITESAKRPSGCLPLCVAIVIAASPVQAQDRPFHVEANVGRTAVDDIDGIRLDESATAFRLGTGYRFLPWLGVSGGYVDVGTIEASVDLGGGTPEPVKATADGFETALTGHVPLTDRFALTAHAGILWWNGDTTVSGLTSSDSGSDSTWGVGAEYSLNATFNITAGWRRYTIDNVDADVTWLGLQVRFGDATR
jgi:hypothetical protein